MTQDTRRGLATAALLGALAFLFMVLCVAITNAQSPSNTCNNGDVLVVNTGGSKNNQCIPPNAQPAGTGSTMIVANASVTGTTVNKFAKLTGAPSTAVVSSNGDTDGAIGIVTSGAGTTGSATITILGQASCVFDGATTAGDYVTIAATGGGCHDAGATYPTGSTVYGRVLSTNGGAGTYVTELMTPDITGSAATSGNGKSKPGGSDTNVQFNDSNAFNGVSQFTWNKTTQVLTLGGSGAAHGSLKLLRNTGGNQMTLGWNGFAQTVSTDEELDIGGGGETYFYAGGSVRWRFSSDGTFLPYGSDGGFSIGANGGGGKRVNRIHLAGPIVYGGGGTTTSTPNVTQGSGTINTGGEVRDLLYKSTLTQANFSAAATTADATVATLPSKTLIIGIWADVTQVFSGGAVATATMTCGKTAGGNEYLVSFDVKSATITRGLVDGDLGTSINRANAVQGGDLPSFTGTTAVQCRMTTTGANTNALTQGSITYYLRTLTLP